MIAAIMTPNSIKCSVFYTLFSHSSDTIQTNHEIMSATDDKYFTSGMEGREGMGGQSH